MPRFKLSADPAVQTLCCVSLCCETTDRSKDCSWSWHCLSWGFFCKWCSERLWYLLSVTQLLLFLLSERSFGLFASAAARLLTVVLCSSWFRSTNAILLLKDLCTFSEAELRNCRKIVFCFYYSSHANTACRAADLKVSFKSVVLVCCV